MSALVDLQRQIDQLRAMLDYVTSLQNVADSGTYTPTLTNTTNIDDSTAFQCQYLRVGSVVTVSGRVEVDATAAAPTLLEVSLPIASNFGAVAECAGVLARSAGGRGEVRAETTNNTAAFSWTATVTTNAAYYFTFTYLII